MRGLHDKITDKNPLIPLCEPRPKVEGSPLCDLRTFVFFV